MRDPAKIRRAIVTAAINECQQLLVPYRATRPWDYDAAWRIVSQMAIDQDTNHVRHYVFGDIDIYEFCWKLDYYAYDCTTSYMDIFVVLRRSITSYWLQDQRAKLRKKEPHGRRIHDPAGAGRSSKGKRLAKDAKRR